MRHNWLLKKARKLQTAARHLGRLKDPALGGADPYIEGAIDPLTGRPQGPDIDKMTPSQRQSCGIPPGVTNAQRRAAFRREMVELGFPPVGHIRELADEELDKLGQMLETDQDRERLDLPFDPSRLNPAQRAFCADWHSQVQRGAMTREEYHRLALELAGLTPDAPSSNPSSGE